MTQEELQRKYDTLFEKVRRMRGHQKEYFKYRTGKDLETAKRIERELDQLIKVELERRNSKQGELL